MLVEPTNIRIHDQVKVVVDRSCLQGEVVLISLKGVEITNFNQEKPHKTMFVKWCNVLEKVSLPQFDMEKSHVVYSFQSDTLPLKKKSEFEIWIENIKNGTPLVGEAYDILVECWQKSLKDTSEIKGML